MSWSSKIILFVRPPARVVSLAAGAVSAFPRLRQEQQRLLPAGPVAPVIGFAIPPNGK